MITLYFLNGRAYIWNAEDWMTLRKTHRIVGELLGAIASFPRHEGYPGFPMALMAEEAAFLVENGKCKLVECTDLQKGPDEKKVKLMDEIEKRLYEEQMESMKEKRIEQISTRIDMIIAGKMKKMNQQGIQSDCNRETLLQEEINKVPILSAANTLVQIPTEHPWPSETRTIEISELCPSITTDLGKLRYTVFCDMWKKGYYITAGTKFGGDFLIYPGDPAKFHAMYIVRCINNAQNEFKPYDIVSFGRLGVSVNKLTVYAYFNSQNSLTYQTLQWHET